MESKNLITIVMALYKPDLKWLAEELDSIHDQTFKKFKLLAWNDCPDDDYDYNLFFRIHLKDIEFKIYQGEKNLGSNLVFGELTDKADTRYIAYSDQDDIWAPDKLEKLYAYIEKHKVSLVCSNMSIIDENSKQVASCIEEVRPHHEFHVSGNVFAHLLEKNFVTGCTTLVDAEMAKGALPFPERNPFHDWWLALCASCHQGVGFINEPLMHYRIHSRNQSAILKGVEDKKSYYVNRIEKYDEFIHAVSRLVKEEDKDKKALIQRNINWSTRRRNYFNHPGIINFFKLLKYSGVNRITTIFELLLPLMPSFVFKKIIQEIRAGKL